MASSSRNPYARDTNASGPSFVTLSKDNKAVWEPGLAAEVTSRRVHKAPRKKDLDETAPVSCDLNKTLGFSPEARAEWLELALLAIPKGRAKHQEVVDIVVHKKFASGLPDALGHKMLTSVKESLVFFTEKQRLEIARCKLAKDFKIRRNKDVDSQDDSDSDRERPEKRRADDRGKDTRRKDDDGRGRDKSPGASRRRDASRSPELAPEDRAEQSKIEEEYAERQRAREQQREDELKRLEDQRKEQEDREAKRKSRLGSAFLMDEEEEEPDVVTMPASKRDDKSKAGDQFLGSVMTTARSNRVDSVPAGEGDNNAVVEAYQILKKGSGAFLAANVGSRSRSRERSRERGSRRKSRSRSRRGRDRQPKRREVARAPYDSLRSPTPDGHARGQMRAARKAKLMQQMLAQGNVPRVA